MATRKQTAMERDAELVARGYTTDGHGTVTGFMVRSVVGTVSFTDTDTGDTPFVAACRMVEEGGGTGTFTFPHSDTEGTVELTIPAYNPPTTDTDGAEKW